MAQEQMVLRRIDWQGTFAFTRLFSGFRLARHSTKILLALAGLFLTFLLGWTMDALWVSAGQGAWRGEIAIYAATGGQRGYDAAMADRRYDALADMLLRYDIAKARDDADKQAQASPAGSVEMIEERIVARYLTARGKAETPEAHAAVLGQMQEQLAALRAIEPVGPFHEVVTYSLDSVRNAMFAAAQLRFTDGLDAVLRGPMTAPLEMPRMAGVQPGVFASLVMLWYGLVWLLTAHWFYSLIFLPIALAIWAVAGGAISRAAVMEFARDERIGIREAVQFSIKKFWGFFFAPVVALGFILAFGLLLIGGGLVGSIPVVGDLVVGVLWLLALAAGLAIAFITIGLLAGGHLFAPVIAAEGSDAFDAISRGFVYVYSRPWKAILYGLTLVVYGSLCYLFLRFFVWLMLAATHAFVGAGMVAGRPQAGPGMQKLDVVWEAPTFLSLRPQPLDWQLLGVGEVILMTLVAFWVYVVWGLLQSWLISFYFTGSSMAYLLLRREVDAIDPEEIYLEEEPETEPLATEPAASPAGGDEAPAAATEVAPAGKTQSAGTDGDDESQDKPVA